MSDLIQSCPLSSLLPQEKVSSLIRSWLEEDTPNFDFGTFVVGQRHQRAQLLIKSPGVIAGIPFFNAIFHQLDCRVEWSHGLVEGDYFDCKSPVQIAEVKGACKNILTGERIALNCLCRASGIATVTRTFIDKAHKEGK